MPTCEECGREDRPLWTTEAKSYCDRHMYRYEVTVSWQPDQGPDGVSSWQAELFAIDSDGESGDLICVGYGAGPRSAVYGLWQTMKGLDV